jgi:hypothetical protein
MCEKKYQGTYWSDDVWQKGGIVVEKKITADNEKSFHN